MIEHTFVILAYKESKYLESCINSVINQDVSSKIVIATSTPNEYITNLGDKYKLDIIVNSNSGRGIGYDFDFALSCGKTQLVTIAHQDDIYNSNYSKEVIKSYESNRKALIIFSDYYEIRDDVNVESNRNLEIKRKLLLPLRIKQLTKYKFIKRLVLRFGCSICCPAVTFVKPNIKMKEIFDCDFKCDVDWSAWEKLSKEKGGFVFVRKMLMGHRVHSESTTTQIIENNIRTKEDLIMFNRFWPSFIAKRLNKFYIKSEDSNT